VGGIFSSDEVSEKLLSLRLAGLEEEVGELAG